MTHRLLKHALTHRANVRLPPVMSIAAHIAGARPVAPRQTVAAAILSVSDLVQAFVQGHATKF
jgi:hypothetical protein